MRNAFRNFLPYLILLVVSGILPGILMQADIRFMMPELPKLEKAPQAE